MSLLHPESNGAQQGVGDSSVSVGIFISFGMRVSKYLVGKKGKISRATDGRPIT